MSEVKETKEKRKIRKEIEKAEAADEALKSAEAKDPKPEPVKTDDSPDYECRWYVTQTTVAGKKVESCCGIFPDGEAAMKWMEDAQEAKTLGKCLYELHVIVEKVTI